MLIERACSGLVIDSAKDEAVMVRLVLVAAIVALTVVLLAGCGGGADDRAKVEANLQRFLATPEHAPGFPVGGGPPRVKDHACFKVEGSHTVLRLITAKDLPPGMKAVLPPGMTVVLAPSRNVALAPGMKMFAPPGWRSLGTGASASNWNCVVKIGTTAIPVMVTVEDESDDVLMAGPRLPNSQSEPRIYENRCKPEPKTRTRLSTCTKVVPGSVSPVG